jgi:TetR/AcrR family transcriptional regulator, regulator of cefoperazone and chloramphenicol sensitivity
MTGQATSRRSRRPERGDDTRSRLLAVAIDVFGRNGFDATTTRTLADAAGVNLQAIGYYFGGKEGLYVAAAEHIASSISAHVAEAKSRLESRLAKLEVEGKPISRDEARDLLSAVLQALATIFTSDESEPWARFLIREQLEPTEAFRRVYDGAMKPLLELVGKLVGVLLKENPSSEHIRLRALSLVGGLMVFRVARAAVEAQLGWNSVEDREVEQIRSLADELASGLAQQGSRNEEKQHVEPTKHF